MDYKNKYLKYKSKYLELKKNQQEGGGNFEPNLLNYQKFNPIIFTNNLVIIESGFNGNIASLPCNVAG